MSKLPTPPEPPQKAALVTPRAASPARTTRRGPAPLPARAPSVRRRPSRRLTERALRTARPRRMAWVETLLHSVLAFGGAALAVSCVVSLAGNVLLESSRRATIEMGARLRSEEGARAELRGRVEALASAEAVEGWARGHGLLAADEAPVAVAPAKAGATAGPKAAAGRTLVARR